MARKPLVTVVVPAGDGARDLARTLSAIENQTMANFECIVIDDASRDGTAEVAHALARRDPRFRVIAHRAASGVAAARLTGIRAARTPLVAVVDPGAAPEPAYLATAAAARLAEPATIEGPDGSRDGTVMWTRSLLDRAGPDRRPSAQTEVDILFIPHREYHLRTVALLTPLLSAAGATFAVADPSAHCGEGGNRTAALELGLDLLGFGEFMLGHVLPRLVVAFNDWDPIIRSVFHAASGAGIATACIVEGIQDYRDADTGRLRAPYRAAQHVLLPGVFDERYFRDSDQRSYVAGIPRIARLRAETHPVAFPDPPVALINSNFTYNVLTDRRDRWLTEAVEACRTAGLETVISRHPADGGTLFGDLVTSETFGEAVERSSIVIQRFASGMLEAMARGKPVVYFNPHGERVDTFAEPHGAYPIVTDKAALATLLSRPMEAIVAEHAPHWDAFLDLHAGPREPDAVAETIRVLREILEHQPGRGSIDAEAFRDGLRMIDLASGALSRLRPLEKAFEAPYAPGAAAGSRVGGVRDRASLAAHTDIGSVLSAIRAPSGLDDTAIVLARDRGPLRRRGQRLVWHAKGLLIQAGLPARRAAARSARRALLIARSRTWRLRRPMQPIR